MSASTQHYVFFAAPLVGHCRPMINFAMNLLKVHSGMKITFICHAVYANMIEAEVCRHLQYETLSTRLNLLWIGKSVARRLDMSTEVVPCLKELLVAFPAIYSDLLLVSTAGKHSLASHPEVSGEKSKPREPATRTFDLPPTLVLADGVLNAMMAKREIDDKIGVIKRIPFIRWNAVPGMSLPLAKASSTEG